MHCNYLSTPILSFENVKALTASSKNPYEFSKQYFQISVDANFRVFKALYTFYKLVSVFSLLSIFLCKHSATLQ